MKYIKKSREPGSLTIYRKKKDAYFDGYPEKDDLRKYLLKEQKYICCYCMSRIIKKDEIEKIDLRSIMKIEHRKSQTKFSDEQLSYNNLLGACNGNEGKPKHLQHCDTHKLHYDGKIIEDKPFKLTINPTLSICELQVKFKSSGEIYSKDAVINNDLTETLNLNCEFLVRRRKEALDKWLDTFTQENPKGTWSKAIWQRELDKWENSSLEEYSPYCQVVIAYLKDKIKKAR